ncbi:MAG: hypothetical protein GY857_09125 [Desulfobacula sp.]|nr:hypothetical protein [Desulfobacula sp.]
MNEAIYICSPDFHIEYMNPSMIHRVGLDATGECCYKTIYHKDEKCSWCVLDQVLQGEHIEYELANPMDNHFYSISNSPVNHTDTHISKLTIFRDITEKKKMEKQLVSSLDEKVVLLREIHHRVKNNMQVIVSLLRLHGRRINDANLAKVFEDCRDRINAMSLIHESLYQSDNLARIDFKVYLKKLCRNLSHAYGASGKGIALTVGECNVTLDMDQGIAIGMVITELVSNSFKHAFLPGKRGNISLNMFELDEKSVQLIINDDGKGIPPEVDIMNPPSLGLQLAVSAVTMELGGTIEVEREDGTQFTICFKYKRK